MAKRSVAVLGIDLGKNSCSLVGFDATGAVVLRRRARRETVVGLTAEMPACLVAMQACCGAHHLGRLLDAQGHAVRLMSPEYVRPYGRTTSIGADHKRSQASGFGWQHINIGTSVTEENPAS